MAARSPLILSPFVLAELGYFLAREAGVDAELTLLGEVARGVYELVPFREDDVRAAAAVIEQYRDLGIGLVDASLVVLAERFDTERVLTLDDGRFRALRTTRGRPFVLLPADG
jgi:predicted nucleic acid-binding protein